MAELALSIKALGKSLGLADVGISAGQLAGYEERFSQWIAQGYHGEMEYMARYGPLRARPTALASDAPHAGSLRPEAVAAGDLRVISVRLNYFSEAAAPPATVLADGQRAYVSRYALGRDYHKVLRRRLTQFADALAALIGPLGHRVFVDTGPLLEKPLAEQAGLGWIGKHTNLIASHDGSWFFLGELLVDVPLPTDAPAVNRCGRCRACIDICPTQAIVAPYQLDARRCLAYHSIELFGPIPVEFRRALGNRVYGCDDCQLICPWNRFATASAAPPC